MHYADDINEYANWSTSIRFLDTAAAAWETTNVLGECPDEYAAVARQKPNSSLWHVGAISNSARTIDMNFWFLDSGPSYEYELTTNNGRRDARSRPVATSGDTLPQNVPDNGGFTVLLYPQDTATPTTPSNLKSPSQSSLSVELSWDAATDGETKIHHYNVSADGANVVQWNYWGGDNQQWTFTPV